MSKKVFFSEDNARRIAQATVAVERGNLDQSPVFFRQPTDDGEPLRLGKTTATWTKGTTATIDLYENGTPGSETSSGTLAGCVNRFATVASGKWVMVARGPLNAWYLVSAEC